MTYEYKSSIKPKILSHLAGYLALLPSIGMKTATRLSYFIITKLPRSEIKKLAELLNSIDKQTKFCSFCNVLSDTNPCSICADTKRDHTKLLLVESSLDVYKIEDTHVYNGLYYVLQETDMPSQYIDTGDSHDKPYLSKTLQRHLIKRLCNLTKKLRKSQQLEVIFGLPIELDTQGIFYTIKELIKSKCKNKVVLSRLAVGLSIGADIEYVDPKTLVMAINNRQRENGD